jgi:hypothetical protein
MCAPGDIIPAIIERNGPDDIVPDLIDADSCYFVHYLTGASVVFNGVFGDRHDAPGTDGRFQFRLRVPLPRLSTIWLLPENIVDAETGVAMMAPTTIFSEAVVGTGLFYREEDEDEEGDDIVPDLIDANPYIVAGERIGEASNPGPPPPPTPTEFLMDKLAIRGSRRQRRRAMALATSLPCVIIALVERADFLDRKTLVDMLLNQQVHWDQQAAFEELLRADETGESCKFLYPCKFEGCLGYQFYNLLHYSNAHMRRVHGLVDGDARLYPDSSRKKRPPPSPPPSPPPTPPPPGSRPGQHLGERIGEAS